MHQSQVKMKAEIWSIKINNAGSTHCICSVYIQYKSLDGLYTIKIVCDLQSSTHLCLLLALMQKCWEVEIFIMFIILLIQLQIYVSWEKNPKLLESEASAV